MSSQASTPSGSTSAPVCVRKQLHKAKRVSKKKSSVKAEDLKIQEILNKQFHRVTENDIKKFYKQYKGSEEEMEDIRKAWIKSKGKMPDVMENVMCAEDDDEPRVQEIVRQLVQGKKAPMFKDGPKYKWLTANMASKQSRGRSKTPERAPKKSGKAGKKSKSKARKGSRKRSTSRSSSGKKAARRSRRR